MNLQNFKWYVVNMQLNYIDIIKVQRVKAKDVYSAIELRSR